MPGAERFAGRAATSGGVPAALVTVIVRNDVRVAAWSALIDAVTVTVPAPCPPGILTRLDTDRSPEPRSPTLRGPPTSAPGADRLRTALCATAPRALTHAVAATVPPGAVTPVDDASRIDS